MTYRLVYTKSAFSDIRRLDPVARRKIQKKIEAFSQKPLFFGKKLVKSKIGGYRWRVGNYRIVFDLDGEKIVVLRVGHRREVYR
jgi:mRNA interferase RelE/StbE